MEDQDPRIQALRESILSQEEIRKTPIPPKLNEIKEIEKLKVALERRKLPCLLIYITGEGESRHANFHTTIMHEQGAEMCAAIIEANRAAFLPVSTQGGPTPTRPH